MELKVWRKLDEIYFLRFFNRGSRTLVNLEDVENARWKHVYRKFNFQIDLLRFWIWLSSSSDRFIVVLQFWFDANLSLFVTDFNQPSKLFITGLMFEVSFSPQNRVYILRTGNLKKISIFVSFIKLLTCEWKVSTNRTKIARDIIENYFHKFMVIVGKIKYVSLWIERNLVVSHLVTEKKVNYLLL